MNIARIRLAVVAGTLALGCKIAASGPVVVRIQAIDVAPARLALMPFQSADLTIGVTTSRDDSGAAASALQWSTSGGVISNNYLVGGVRHVTYQSPGQAGEYLFIVTTVYGTPADTAHISVTTTAVPVHTVTVTPGTVGLAVGDTAMLRTTLADSTGAVVVGREITWSTSDAGVATVLATGFVRAMAAGTATITATTEGQHGTSVITVTPAPVP